MADFVDMLVGMGFDRDKAAKAVEKTGNKGVEVAMEWILANPDGPSGSSAASAPNSTEGGTDDSSSSAAAAAAVDAVPKSYKCEDCGKLFTSMETVEFHAAKTNHSNFSESTEEKKPLTAEEKEEQQKKLLELLKLKRGEREEKEKKENLEREKQRMASGKDLLEAKRRLEEQQMKELIEQRKREKIEEKQARDRVKAMIEADKLARKAKFGGGGESSNTEQSTSSSNTPSISQKASVEEVPAVKKDYTETKLQLRLPNGKVMVQSFGVSEPLAAVRVYIEVNRDDGQQGIPFNLMTNFPRKVFQADDYDKPLVVLGLVPSAVLMVTRATPVM